VEQQRVLLGRKGSRSCSSRLCRSAGLAAEALTQASAGQAAMGGSAAAEQVVVVAQQAGQAVAVAMVAF
jgi:hypothetical protein